MNNNAVNMCVQISLWVPVFSSLGYKFKHEIAQPCGNSIFKFLRNRILLFYIMSVPFHIPTNSAQGLQFLHILSQTQVSSCPTAPYSNHPFFFLNFIEV